jgi:hypothetical protein
MCQLQIVAEWSWSVWRVQLYFNSNATSFIIIDVFFPKGKNVYIKGSNARIIKHTTCAMIGQNVSTCLSTINKIKNTLHT